MIFLLPFALFALNRQRVTLKALIYWAVGLFIIARFF